MLQARKVSVWKGAYEISVDGTPLTTWTSRTWKSGGSFPLDGAHYEVGANVWGSQYGMSTADGKRVASADRVGRKRWTVDADGRIFTFGRASAWRSDQLLLDGDREVGSVRRTNWRGDAEADLPGLSLPAQVFALAVVLSMWEAQAAAAAG
jgi:hypothetical protein